MARQISARAVTAMARESHPLGQCTLLGELMDETHTRYCYRRRVDKRSPTIHLVPLRPVPTTPHHQRTGSSSRTWLRRRSAERPKIALLCDRSKPWFWLTRLHRGMALRLRVKRRWRSLPDAAREQENCLCRTRRSPSGGLNVSGFRRLNAMVGLAVPTKGHPDHRRLAVAR